MVGRPLHRLRARRDVADVRVRIPEVQVKRRHELRGAPVRDRLGVPHEDVKDLGVARMVELRDPDGIALELWQTTA